MEISGIYLVIDPAMDEKTLLRKLDALVDEPIAAVQLWDNFRKRQPIEKLIHRICERCLPAAIPVLINNRWEYLQHTPLHGVHFDHVPHDLEKIKAEIGRPFITGLTCNNDLTLVRWSADHKLDYISFCSMFPSNTANSCELVNFETVREARRIFSNPIFLAGGIRPDNLDQLASLEYDGVAVVSGIMNAKNTKETLKQYYQHLVTRR